MTWIVTALRENPELAATSCSAWPAPSATWSGRAPRSAASNATAALRAVQDEARSTLPVLDYTVPYAIGNLPLTARGPVIVLLTR